MSSEKILLGHVCVLRQQEEQQAADDHQKTRYAQRNSQRDARVLQISPQPRDERPGGYGSQIQQPVPRRRKTLIDERFSATGYGLLNLTSVSAGALISWLGGYLKDSGIALGVPLSIAGFLMVICGLLFFLLPKNAHVSQ